MRTHTIIMSFEIFFLLIFINNNLNSKKKMYTIAKIADFSFHVCGCLFNQTEINRNIVVIYRF